MEATYPIVIRQVYVDVAQSFIWMIFGVLLFSFATMIWKKNNGVPDKYKKEDLIKDYKLNSRGEFYISGLSMLWILGIAFTFINLTSVVSMLINPHWYAIQKILELL